MANKFVPLDELLPFTERIERYLEGVTPSEYHDAGVHLARALRKLGTDSSFEDELREHYFERALAEARRFDWEKGNAKTAIDFGRFLLDRGRNSEALDVFLGGLAGTPDGWWPIPWLHERCAEANRRMGRSEAALDHVQRGRTALQGMPYLHGEPIARMLPGQEAQIYLELGLPDVAAPMIEELVARAREARKEGTAAWIAVAFVDEVNLALGRGDPVRVDRLALDALEDIELFERYPTYRAALQLLRGEALVRLERRDPTRPRLARDVLFEALAVEGLPARLQVLGHLQLAEALLENAQHEEARESLVEARSVLDRWTLDEELRRPVPELALLHALEARLAIESGAGLEELIRVQARLDVAFEELLVLWHQTPLRAGGVGFLEDWTRLRVLSETCRIETLVGGRERGPARSFGKLARAQGMSTDARVLGLETLSLEELQRDALPPGHGLLLWLPGPNRSHVFACDREGVVSEELSAYHTLRSAIERYKGLIDQPPWLADDPAQYALAERQRAEQLAVELFPEHIVERIRGWSAVTIVAPDLMLDVPFEALPVGGEEFLGTWRAVGSLPSLLWLGTGMAGASELVPTSELFLVHSPTLAPAARERWPHLEALRVGADQVSALAAPFTRLVERTGPEARLDELPPASSGHVRALCIITHGVNDPLRERPAGLALAAGVDGGDGIAWTSDIDAFALDSADLVVLAACRTGGGRERAGDFGAARMASSWLRGGAGVVLHSTSDLALEPTLELLTIFFERVVEEGDTPAEALRSAREELVRDGRWSAPFCHARIQVTGAVHTALFPKPSGRAWFQWALGGAALLLVGGAAALLRRRPGT